MKPLRRLLGSKLLRDTATLQVAGGLNQISQVASSIVIAYLLGATGQGLFALAVALQAFAYFLLNVGVVPATVSQIAAASARGMDHKAAAWIAFIAKMILVMTGLVVLFGWLVLPSVAEWWYDDRRVGVWAVWLSIQPLLGLPKGVATVAFQGTRRMLALGQLENGHEVVRFFLVALGALVTGSPAGAVVGQLLSSAFGAVVAGALYYRARRDGGYALPSLIEILRWMPEVPILKGMRLGFRVGLVKNMHMMVLSIWPRLAIGAIVSPAYVAYFNIAQQIISVPMMLTTGVSRTMLPALGELRGLRDAAAFTRLFLRAALVTGTVITACIIACIAVAPFLLELVFPADYAAPVTHYAMILGVGAAVFSFAVANEAFFIATNQVRLWLWLSGVGTVVTVPTAAWMALSWSPWGAAIGVSFIQMWVLVHFACIAIYLSRSRHDVPWQTEAPAAVSADD